jgi:deoxyribonuclease V
MSTPQPLAVVDVHYAGDAAHAACLIAADWLDSKPIEVQRAWLSPVAPYVPGQFYERELPPVLQVLAQVRTDFKVIVVDSYVVLDGQGSPGLGAHLWQHFDGRYAVIGVAKTSYRRSTFAATVKRGQSERTLFVTALGMDQPEAAQLVATMHGEHRLPTLLGLADHHARGLAPSAPPLNAGRAR